MGLALHVQGKVRLSKQFKEDTQLAAERPTAFEYWTDVRAAGFEDEAAFDVDYGPVTIRITFAVPGEFLIWHASTPDSPPDRRESFYLEKLATSARILTTFRSIPVSERPEK